MFDIELASVPISSEKHPYVKRLGGIYAARF